MSNHWSPQSHTYFKYPYTVTPEAIAGGGLLSVLSTDDPEGQSFTFPTNLSSPFVQSAATDYCTLLTAYSQLTEFEMPALSAMRELGVAR